MRPGSFRHILAQLRHHPVKLFLADLACIPSVTRVIQARLIGENVFALFDKGVPAFSSV